MVGESNHGQLQPAGPELLREWLGLSNHGQLQPAGPSGGYQVQSKPFPRGPTVQENIPQAKVVLLIE